MVGTTCANMSNSPESTLTTAQCNDIKYILLAGYIGMSNTAPVMVSIPDISCPSLPDNISYAEGALLEPLSVVMHGIQSAGLSLGRGVVVCGAGPVGLIALAAARASGAHPVVITDIEPRRLAFAKEFTPSCITYQVNPDLDAEGNGNSIRALFGPEEYFAPQTILECTGAEGSVCTAAYAVRRGGMIMVIGVGKSVMNNLPFMHIALAEVRSCSSSPRL